jgi:peptidoglycan/LPS O-acetylase OafA/YrhL
MPGLDGLRAIAVAAVVIYHIWPEALPAGFLGVSMFFTLSGFLITRLLLLDHAQTGGVSLRRFWIRRFRRLMPAAMAVLVAISAIWLITAWMTKPISGDITAALFYVANWRFLFTGSAYGAATETSPVLHFWSLAIEEQFYLVYPLAVWAVLRSKRATIFNVGVLLGGLLGVSLVYIGFNSGHQLVIYYSTFSRAAELLVGGLLAVATAIWPLDRIRSWIRPVGLAAGAILVVLMFRTDVYTPLYFEGGLAAVALLSAAVILAATHGGSFERALSLKPLLWLGLVSYAVYLIHWPLLMALREAGITAWLVSVTTVVGTLVLATLSGRLLEWPIREARWVRPRPALLVAPAITLVLVMCLIGSRTSGASAIDYAAAQASLDQLAETAATSIPPQTDPAAVAAATPAAARPISLAFFGDSTALMLAVGAGNAGPGLRVAGDWSRLGCTISRGGELKGFTTSDKGPPGSVDHCDWTTAWPQTIPAGGVDRAIVYAGFWDTLPRRVPGVFTGWETIEDEVYRNYLRSEMNAASETLHSAGAAKVVWLTLAPNAKENNATNARRVALYNTLIDDTVAAHPDYAVKIDLGAYLTGPGKSLRLDGVHVSPETGATLWNDWLLDQVIKAGSDASGQNPGQ